MAKIETVEILENNLEESYTFNKIAKQASGSVWYRQKKAVLLAVVAVEEKPVDEDFLPLTVQYIEKAYAASKIPGGFIKREAKPSDFETLTSRIIDRSLRPLFPKGFLYPVTITIMVVSVDSEVDMQIAALHAANAALRTSSLPIENSVSAVRLGTIDDELIINPQYDLFEEHSTLDLLVVGSQEDIMMIEMRSIASKELPVVIETSMVDPSTSSGTIAINDSNVVSEDILMSYIQKASETIKSASHAYETIFSKFKKPVLNLQLDTYDIDKELYEYIDKNYHDRVKDAIKHMSKSERSMALKELRGVILEDLTNKGEAVEKEVLSRALYSLKRDLSRSIVLDDKVRADGRAYDEVRPIDIETNILPSVHGSCLFTRGETQALVAVTLGDKKDAQMYEYITDKSPRLEQFMVHYNFPAFSVGEAKPIGPIGRRELGHGNLAKRALEPMLGKEIDGTIRLVSEILESNGSSSMATVCGGSLALQAAEVATETLVAGIAMGLVYESDTKYAILTDIMGLEDHDGDMDFKIAGSREGISALQMDIKISGASLKILDETLRQAKKGKEHILSIMEQSSKAIKPSGALPSIEFFNVHPSKIVDIIGKAGATIRDIIERFEVSIDIDREKGDVKLVGGDKKKIQEAKEHIQNIANKEHKEHISYEIGGHYHGKIKKIVDFGVFVEMPDGFDALLHISKISKERVENLKELYNEGDPIEVVVLEQKGKKVELATLEFVS
ncbi:MAG: polyribonucleotide nucleotidyltransferase [Campylobacterales bacterium]|nr:polyribonucleotide nucleotidyltransferase [Campylobacterales bacterium]